MLIPPVGTVTLGVNGASGHRDLHPPLFHVESVFAVIGNGKTASCPAAHVQKTLHIVFHVIADGTRYHTVGGFRPCLHRLFPYRVSELHKMPGVVESKPVLHPQLFFLLTQKVQLLQLRILIRKPDPDHLPEIPAFHLLYGVQTKVYVQILIPSALKAAPGIPLIQIQTQGSGSCQSVIARLLVHERRKHAGRLVKLRQQTVILQPESFRIKYLHVGRGFQSGFLLHHLISGKPTGRDRSMEHKPPPAP